MDDSCREIIDKLREYAEGQNENFHLLIKEIAISPDDRGRFSDACVKVAKKLKVFTIDLWKAVDGYLIDMGGDYRLYIGEQE